MNVLVGRVPRRRCGCALGTESLEDRRLLSGAGTFAEGLPSSDETGTAAAPAIVQVSVVSSDEMRKASQKISPVGEEAEKTGPSIHDGGEAPTVAVRTLATTVPEAGLALNSGTTDGQGGPISLSSQVNYAIEPRPFRGRVSGRTRSGRRCRPGRHVSLGRLGGTVAPRYPLGRAFRHCRRQEPGRDARQGRRHRGHGGRSIRWQPDRQRADFGSVRRPRRLLESRVSQCS